MKISSKLLISSFLPTATAALAAILVFSSAVKEREAEQRSTAALAVFKTSYDLTHRVNYFILYREERSVKEWFSLHRSLTDQVSRMSFNEPEQDAVLDRIRENTSEMKKLFTAIVSPGDPKLQASRALLHEAENRLIGQLFIRTRYLSSDSLQLYELSKDERDTINARTHVQSIALILLSGVVVVAALLPINRNIISAIKRLTAGASELGAGKFSYRIGLDKPDEFGELAVAFDRMAEQLQSITVSREELAREIEERRLAEEALRSSEARFRWLYESGLVAMAFWEIGGAITEANLSFCRMIGIEPEELRSGRITWEEITPRELILRDLAAFEQISAWGYCEPYEKELVSRHDGRRVPVMVAKALMAGSSNEGIAFAIDLTERKRAEEALRQSEATLKLAIESTGIGTFDYQVAKDELVWSEMTNVHFGLLPDAPVDYRLFLAGISSDDRERVEELMHSALKGENGGKLDVEFRTVGVHDSRERWITMRGQVLFDDRSQAVRLIGTTLDITERKRSEEELMHAMTELERSNRELEQFAYVASHDLQEPLRMVASFVQLLAKKYRENLDEKAHEYIGFAVEGALRMQKLIEGLLAYSRISRGRPFQFVNTNETFQEAVDNLSTVIREKGAVVTRGYLPVVSGDNIQLLQLFQNLLGNAIKYRKKAQAPTVHVSAQRKGFDWIFSFRDNGIGIDPAFHQKIFLIFQRLHDRGEYPGTGIGLALCKRIVERHGGRMWVESTPGEGAEFLFTIPISGGSQMPSVSQ